MVQALTDIHLKAWAVNVPEILLYIYFNTWEFSENYLKL